MQTDRASAYEESLLAIQHLGRRLRWQPIVDVIQHDLVAWRQRRDSTAHRRHYGGMGSFSDFFVCKANFPVISDEQAPWLDQLLSNLQGLALRFGDRPHEVPSAELIRKHHFYQYKVRPRARTPEQALSLLPEEFTVSGWECRSCGAEVLPQAHVDSAIAPMLLSGPVAEACERGELIELVDRVFALDIPEMDTMRAAVELAATRGGIEVSRDGRLPHGHNCREYKPGTCRWTIRGGKLVPKRDCLWSQPGWLLTLVQDLWSKTRL